MPPAMVRSRGVALAEAHGSIGIIGSDMQLGLARPTLR